MKNKFVKNIPRNILIMIILIFITFRYLLRGFSRKEVIHAFFNADKRILGFGIVLSLLYMLCEGYNTKSMDIRQIFLRLLTTHLQGIFSVD